MNFAFILWNRTQHTCTRNPIFGDFFVSLGSNYVYFHSIVEYFETQNDGDGPVHIIRAGKVKREIFDEILAEAGL